MSVLISGGGGTSRLYSYLIQCQCTLTITLTFTPSGSSRTVWPGIDRLRPNDSAIQLPVAGAS